MENEKKFVTVTNRHSGTVGYIIPETGTRRVFARGESKKISYEELERLSWIEGGEYILQNYLMINDNETLDSLNMGNQEPEYFYTEADVKKLLLEGTLDQLEDALNFAPEGVLKLIQDIAVAIELPDTRKRKMISEKLGFSIDNAISVNAIMAEEIEEDAGAGKVERKAKPITETAPGTTARKTTGFKSMT